MSRQRAFLSAPGEALPDWRQMCEVARRMGFGDAFAYRSPAEIFGEYAALTAIENDGRRDLDLGALADISDARLRRAGAFPMAAPRGRGARRDALLRRRPLLPRRRQGAFRRHALPRSGRPNQRALSVRPQHRPHPRPVAHDDPHREDAAADGAYRRALRRDPPRRREGGRRRGGGPRRNRERTWSRRAARGRHRAAAAVARCSPRCIGPINIQRWRGSTPSPRPQSIPCPASRS